MRKKSKERARLFERSNASTKSTRSIRMSTEPRDQSQGEGLLPLLAQARKPESPREAIKPLRITSLSPSFNTRNQSRNEEPSMLKKWQSTAILPNSPYLDNSYNVGGQEEDEYYGLKSRNCLAVFRKIKPPNKVSTQQDGNRIPSERLQAFHSSHWATELASERSHYQPKDGRYGSRPFLHNDS